MLTVASIMVMVAIHGTVDHLVACGTGYVGACGRGIYGLLMGVLESAKSCLVIY